MSEEAVHKPKTRGGGVFTPAKDVKLHANDFEFAEKVASLEPGDKKILEDYKALMLRGLNGGTVPPSAESPREEKPGEGEPWENHYKQSRHHFPLKNYIIHAFPILGELLRSEEKRYILECGCGTGSTLLPLILEFPDSNATFVGFDISETALKYFSENPTAEKLIGESRLHLFPYDVSRPSEESGENCKRRKMEGEVEENVVVKNVPTLAGTKFDAVLLVFVLSALDHIGNMVLALERLSSLLKPGGVILFRDYAVADHNFFRFLRKNEQNNVEELSFSKGDKTKQFFFEEEFVEKLFSKVNMKKTGPIQYHCNRIENRKNGKRMDKIFINAVFEKC